MKMLVEFSLIIAVSMLLPGCGKPATKNPVENRESAATTAGSAEGNTLTLSQDALSQSHIEIEPAATGRIGRTLRAVGHVSLNLNKTAKVVTTLDGRVTELNADLNDKVKAGDVLGRIDSPELLNRQLDLKAPIDGVVIARSGTVGELISRGDALYTISDPSDLWVLAEIKEPDIGAVRAGQSASFSVLAYPGEKFEGTITRLADQVEPESRTLEARIAVDNADGRLKSGMFADIAITTETIDDALLIPAAAIQTDDEQRPFVFVAGQANEFEKRAIRTGLDDGEHVQVLEGIQPGEKIVGEGSFILKSELQKSTLAEDDD